MGGMAVEGVCSRAAMCSSFLGRLPFASTLSRVYGAEPAEAFLARFFSTKAGEGGGPQGPTKRGNAGDNNNNNNKKDSSTASVNKHEWRDWINKRVSGKEYLAKQAGVDLGVPFLPDPAVSTGGRAGGSGPRLTRDELSDDVALSLFFFFLGPSALKIGTKTELEEEGVLKKGDYEKDSGKGYRGGQQQRRNQHEVAAQQRQNKSALHLAILEELKKLPSPDPSTGFAKLGEREEDDEAAEILAAVAAAAAVEEDEGSTSPPDGEAEAEAEEDPRGKSQPARRQAGGSEDKRPAVGRINPNRLFFPGQTYELEDLDPFSEQPRQRAFQPFRRRRQLFDDDIDDSDDLFLRSLHFLNYDLLSRYVTEQGKILPRRKTRLRKKVQRKLVRTIKTARQMAILPINSRVREDDCYDL